MKFTKIAMWSLLVAMVSPLTSQAVDYDLSVARKFYINGEANPGSTGKSAAASTNKMYVAPTDKTDLYYETMASSCSQGTIASGYSSGQLGSAIANDEAGNIVFHAGEYWASGTPTKFTIIPAGATGMSSKKEITITSPGGRCDFIRATGNLLSGTGYIWFAPNGTKKVVAAKVTNGAYVSNTTYTVNGMTNNFNSVCSAYMYGSNKMFIHNNADSKMYDCTVSGTTVTATAISKTAAIVNVSGDYWQSLVGNIMFELRGHKILVRSNATVNSGTQFSVIDMTDNVALHDNFATWGSSTTTGIGATGVWPTILKEDDNNVAIYVYCPTHGFGKYLVTATPAGATLPTAPVNNLVGTVDENNVASVSWSVPTYDTSVATITGYSVTVGSSSPVTVTETSYQVGEITASTTIKVAPIYALISDPSTTGQGTAQSVTLKPAGNVGPPRNLSIKTYEGRSIVELAWHAPEEAFDKPNGYNVYRDGVLIASNITEMILIDSNVPEGRHEYTVASVYSGVEYPNCSTSINITVDPFNTANNVYKIEEIYDYGIGTDVAASGTGFTGLDNRDNSRQGVVYDGKWYIATGAHQNSTTAGIIMFDIENPRAGGTKLNLTPEIGLGQTPGIGMDSAGNIFVRGYYNTSSVTNSKYDAGVGLVKGVVYKRNANGTYANGIEVDLTGLGIATERATGVGRYDYYYLDGNIFSSAGAKLPIAAQRPTNGKNYSCITLKGSGSTVTASIDFSVATTDPFTATGAESYAFPNIETPGEYIVQARSTAYGEFASGATTGKTLYSGETTCNNSGGTMIKWGNDLLLITPYSMYSANNGSFRVAIARGGALDDLVPLLNINQPATNIGVNSNGLWMYAVESVADECVYLYEYVPGTRFAKYKITRSGTYSFPEPSIDIEPQYGVSANNPERDLARYNANLSWERPKTSTGAYWPETGDNPLIKYVVSVVDKNDNPYVDADGVSYNNYVVDATQPENAGTIVELPMMKDFADNEPYTIKVKAVYDFSGTEKESFERTATSRYTYDPVAPGINVMTYLKQCAKIDQEWVWGGQSHIVPFYYDIYRVEVAIDRPEGYEDNQPVSFYTIDVSKDGGETWEAIQDKTYGAITGGYNGASTAVTTYGDYYQGDYDFENNRTLAKDDSQFESNFWFYYYVDVTNAVNNTLSATDPSQEDPMQWLYRATAHYGSSDEVEIEEDASPVALSDAVVIPVSTKGIAKSASYQSRAGEGVTGVSVVGATPNALVAYPNPAESILNVKAGKALGDIEIYSVAGALVKKVNAGAYNSVAIDVNDLAAGVYYLRAAGSNTTVIKK
ncbi:MAG: T9SS type A sorting domain-containing protein [Muribaculaceae bacterium]|nr:T9SS type A sorting domain-containing protein [Muribaculaceae bacterium]